MLIPISNSILDEFELINVDYLVDNLQYTLNSGTQEYRFYSYLTTFFNGITILDIGTYQGTSAVALSHNINNNVISYNIHDNINIPDHKIYSKSNIVFKIKNGVDALNSLTPDEFIKIKIIMIDTEHFGDEEETMIKILADNNFSGIIILDDIHHPNPTLKFPMEKLWNNITYKKYDITKYAHFSGTGIILMNTDIDFSFL